MVAFGRTGIGGVISGGHRIDRPFLRVWWVVSGEGPRVGILIPRKFGKAYRRNRVRRRLRELVMERLRTVAVPVCMVVKLKRYVGEADYVAVRAELEGILESVLQRFGEDADPCG